MTNSYRAPALWRTLLEARAPAELASLAVTRAFLRKMPRGDGHAVMVLPGFLASDTSTIPLRRTLRRLGYASEGWGQGMNKGPRTTVVEAMLQRLVDLAEHSGGPVSVIGWSLGGVYARTLARSLPDAVRVVVTLVSPFRMTQGDRSRASVAYAALEHPDEREQLRFLRETPLVVPATSLFSKLDGVVDWAACIDDARPHSESIEVRGASHFGIGHNPGALIVIADRLATDPLRWRPFEVPTMLRKVLVPHEQHEI
ncbi:MAG: esterase/lipase family protein [Acidimicrobiia bacterium]